VAWNFLLGWKIFASSPRACALVTAEKPKKFAIFVVVFSFFENSVPVKSSKTAILVLAYY